MKLFNVRYVKLDYKVEIEKECTLPRYKTSTIRGGMGNILLSLCCIGNRDCENCDFYRNCTA